MPVRAHLDQQQGFAGAAEFGGVEAQLVAENHPGAAQPPVYARLDNTTTARFEDALARRRCAPTPAA